MPISWSDLHPFDGEQSRSFEKFCYAIVRRQFENSGYLTPIDDSGGGDGVEFYLTFPDGTEWGWQAKFFYPDNRLRAGGRQEQIKRSLQTSCDNHPNLTKWFLCTPSDFTPEEQSWFKYELSSAKHQGRIVVPEDRNVELIHWGESEFVAWLGEEQFSGIRHFFFGELELSIDWFRQIIEKTLTNVGNKYIPALHTETFADQRVHFLLGDSEFVEQLEVDLERLRKAIALYIEYVETLRQGNPQLINWDGKNLVLCMQAVVDPRSWTDHQRE